MRLLDRYIIRSFLFNYLLAFVVLVGTYILLDLIVNLTAFNKANDAIEGWPLLVSMLADIADYYSYQILVIFQMVSAAIPLLAAGFTMFRMTRHNELIAMLASGVSLYRVALPVVLVSVGFSLLVIVDQEFLMPNVVDKLLRKHGQHTAAVTQDQPLYFVRDNDGSLIMASAYDPTAKKLTRVRIIQRDPEGRQTGRLMADEATWDPEYSDTNGLIKGAWYLKGVRFINDAPNADPHSKAVEIRPDGYHSTRLTPEQIELIFSKKAVEFLSSSQISLLAKSSPPRTQTALEKIMHTRFTQPIMNVVMLLLGIPFLLTREPKRLIINLFYCLGVAGFCFISTFVLFQMAGSVFPPLVGAWLPVLFFAPLSLAMLDTIKT